MTERISDERLAEIKRTTGPDVGLSETLMMARELASLREQVRWIPVTERLPEMAGEGSRFVLTTTADGGWTTVTVSSLHWIHKDASSTGEKCYLTHWREIGPLPGGDV